MFPPAGAIIQYNEAGEPTGWDASESFEPEYFDCCGHYGRCLCNEYDNSYCED